MSRPKKFFILFLCIVFYIVPVWKELYWEGGLLENAVWYVYVLPGIILSYASGLAGGLASALLSVLIALGTVFYEQQYLYQDNPLERQITVDSLLMVGPTVLMSLAVGVMVESLKRKDNLFVFSMRPASGIL